MFSNIVVGVDGRGGGHAAVALAKQLAARDSQLILANFGGDEARPSPSGPGVAPSPYTESESLLYRERRAADIDAELLSLPGVEVGKGLERLARGHREDLLVVGSCHHGPVGRVLLGDDASDALEHAHCPVAIAPQGYTAACPPSRIGVAYDGSAESVRAVETAQALARQFDSKATQRAARGTRPVPAATVE